MITMKTLKMLVEVETSKMYAYSYDSLCASDNAKCEESIE
jgi:hypothetical protein